MTEERLIEFEGWKDTKPTKPLTVRKRRKEESCADGSLLEPGKDDLLLSRGGTLSTMGHIHSYSTANYIGNKREIAEQLILILEKYEVEYNSVFDAFSGSGVVSLLFALMEKEVVSNDLLTGSALQAECLLNVNPSILTEADWMFLINNRPADLVPIRVKDLYPNWGKLLTEEEVDFLDRFRTNLCLRFGNACQIGQCLSGEGAAQNFLRLDGRLVNRCDPRIALALYALVMHINSHCFVGGRYYNGQTLAKLSHRLEHQQNGGLQFFQTLYDHTAHRLQFPAPLRTMKNSRTVYNADIIELLDSGLVKADLLYLDPPYGGEASDYVYKYQFLEEYLQGGQLSDRTKSGGKRFDKKKGFAEQFNDLLDRCGNFPAWLISFNATSFAKLDDIVDLVKKFRPNVVVEDTAKLYKYRKERTIATDKEFLILART